MHPELLNNSIFLRYYNQWQEDPTSILFAPIAEYLQIYGMVEEAITVCQEGLKHHPNLISGRLALAKAYLKKKEFAKAREELRPILQQIPKQPKALELLESIEKEITVELPPPKKVMNWETLTMAKIFAAQGHRERAREVCHAILKREPANKEVQQALAQLESER